MSHVRFALAVFILAAFGLPAFAQPPVAFEDAGLHAVQFVDASEGWACGDDGAIWHSINGGKTWERQKTGTRASIRGVHFVNPYCGWAVGRIGTGMSVDQPAGRVDHEIAAQLQQIIPSGRFARQPTTQHQSQVTPEHPSTKERTDRGPGKPEVAIRLQVRIRQHAKRQLQVAAKRCQSRRRGETHSHDVRPKLLDPSMGIAHLDQMRLAADSGKVPQKDEQERASAKGR